MRSSVWHPLALSLLLLATVNRTPAQTVDEPTRGVARVSILDGEASVRRGDSGDWVAAALNAPLVTTDQLLTGARSRVELQFDYATFLRVDENTELRLADVQYRRYLIQLAQGTTTLRILRELQADVEVSTPSVAVRPIGRGIFRVTVRPDGSSEITVRYGEVDIFTPRGSRRLRSGHTMLARGSQSDPEFQVTGEQPEDEWDRWNQRRDRDLNRTQSYRYLSPEIYGADDLDQHGQWLYVPQYGNVWSPRVAPGWVPYRNGRWTWLDYFGWTWVSYDPWGWAPYHFGRWFYSAPHGWCWFPGQIGVRHSWAPALVAFFGLGRVTVGLGFGNIGWVPLAPYDPFNPWWGSRFYGALRNRTFLDNSVTIVNTDVTNIYRNARVANAVSAMDASNFGRHHGSSIRVASDHLRDAHLVRGQLPLVPDRGSLRWSDSNATVTGSGRALAERAFFSRRQAPTVDRVPFEQQQQVLTEVARRRFGPQDSRPVTASERWEAVGTGETNPSAISPAAGAFNRADGRRHSDLAVDEAVRSGAAEVNRLDANRGEGGDVRWRRFGEPAGDAGAAVQPASGAERWPARNAYEPASGGSWRDAGRGNGHLESHAPSGGSDQGGWRRFGAPTADDTAPDAGPADSQRWSGRGDGGGRGDSAQGNRQTPSQDGTGSRNSSRWDWGAPARRQERPDLGATGQSQHWERSAPEPRVSPRPDDSGGQRWGGGDRSSPRSDTWSGRGESIQVAPPVVQESIRSGGSGRGEPSGMSVPRGGGGERWGGTERNGGERSGRRVNN